VLASPKTTDLTWSLLRTVLVWSVMIAVAVAVASCFVVCDPRFTLTFLFAAAVDVGTLALVLRDARMFVEESAPEAGQRMAFGLGGRLILKAVLLALAAFMTSVFSFPAMVMGVLLVDTTILIIGSAVVIWRMPGLRAPESSRRE